MNTTYREFDTERTTTPPSRSVRIARNSAKGFTLIELLVVISIIALLSTVVLAAVGDARAKARNTAKNSLVLEYVKALELYRSENESYPSAGNGEENIPRCIGYGDLEPCYAIFRGDDQINSAFASHIPGPPASLSSVPIGGADFRGVTYNCNPTGGTSCNNFILIWVLEGANAKCINEATSAPFGSGNTRCQYITN